MIHNNRNLHNIIITSVRYFLVLKVNQYPDYDSCVG